MAKRRRKRRSRKTKSYFHFLLKSWHFLTTLFEYRRLHNEEVLMFGFDWEIFWRICDYLGIRKYQRIEVSRLTHENDKYVMVEVQDEGFWLPKEDIIIESVENGTVIQVPRWLVSRMRRVCRRTGVRI